MDVVAFTLDDEPDLLDYVGSKGRPSKYCLSLTTPKPQHVGKMDECELCTHAVACSYCMPHILTHPGRILTESQDAPGYFVY